MKKRSVLQSARADGDGMRRRPGHLITKAGMEVLRKGGEEEARSVRCMCDVCGEELVAARSIHLCWMIQHKIPAASSNS